MELRQLEYFIAVCEELHFTRAAEKLGLTQPSLSQQISLLEHEVGIKLFDRIGRRIAITESGSILLEHAYRVFHELSQAKAAIGELHGLERGALKVGALLTVVNTLLPQVLIDFHQLYPKIEIAVSGMRVDEIKKSILHNAIDIGIVYLPFEHPEIETISLRKEELVLAMSVHHPLAGQPIVPLHVLKDTAAILLPETYFIRRYLNELCRQEGFLPVPAIELTTLESILLMVQREMGVTVLAKSYLHSLCHGDLSIAKIDHPTMEMEIGIAYRRNKHLCSASREFIKMLQGK
ncbi:LysR family transcriptional regulator [Sporosarcina sp. NCCP-2222]|uniref:LysR family transcriptional regulator n=1 Tax=Sporosarcina sp. NCCP-2222 TaxID=2935073 RepID=UPI002088B4F2|nr:LysR substrate-binding domain-containing protein [Sporosarcina sp. NCCP-2222]GKV56082.1 LysR family transcriptional regulator [Sporosarcina sp. NCCP-2222]